MRLIEVAVRQIEEEEWRNQLASSTPCGGEEAQIWWLVHWQVFSNVTPCVLIQYFFVSTTYIFILGQ